jgi:hypothetical protein
LDNYTESVTATSTLYQSTTAIGVFPTIAPTAVLPSEEVPTTTATAETVTIHSSSGYPASTVLPSSVASTIPMHTHTSQTPVVPTEGPNEGDGSGDDMELVEQDDDDADDGDGLRGRRKIESSAAAIVKANSRVPSLLEVAEVYTLSALEMQNSNFSIVRCNRFREVSNETTVLRVEVYFADNGSGLEWSTNALQRAREAVRTGLYGPIADGAATLAVGVNEISNVWQLIKVIVPPAEIEEKVKSATKPKSYAIVAGVAAAAGAVVLLVVLLVCFTRNRTFTYYIDPADDDWVSEPKSFENSQLPIAPRFIDPALAHIVLARGERGFGVTFAAGAREASTTDGVFLASVGEDSVNDDVPGIHDVVGWQVVSLDGSGVEGFTVDSVVAAFEGSTANELTLGLKQPGDANFQSAKQEAAPLDREPPVAFLEPGFPSPTKTVYDVERGLSPVKQRLLQRRVGTEWEFESKGPAEESPVRKRIRERRLSAESSAAKEAVRLTDLEVTVTLQRGEQLGLRFQGGSGVVLDGGERLGVPPCLKVVHVMPGSPCAKAGLIAGDLIYQIGGEAVEGLSHDDCVLLIRRYPERLVMQIKRAEALVPNSPTRLDSNRTTLFRDGI